MALAADRDREADGSVGDLDGAPRDGIDVTAAMPVAPGPRREHPHDGGRLVDPIGLRRRQRLTATRQGDERIERSDGYSMVMPLIGAGGFEP